MSHVQGKALSPGRRASEDGLPCSQLDVKSFKQAIRAVRKVQPQLGFHEQP